MKQPTSTDPKARGERAQSDRKRWDETALIYDDKIGLIERYLVKDGRAWICSQAHGDVLEVAVGTGRNLPFYPRVTAGAPAVLAEGRIRNLTAVDLSTKMLEIAEKRARELAIAIDLREANVEELPFAAASFDSVVCTLALCSVPDERRALTEMHRVLRPGGTLLLLDHVASTRAVFRVVQRCVELFSGEENMLRRPMHHVRALGFSVEISERYKAGVIERLRARKPVTSGTDDVS